MPRLKKEPGYHYTIVYNDLIYDTRISPKARFISIFMLSKPDNWNFNYKNFEKK